MTAHALTKDLAASYARIALSHVRREFPYKLEHVVTGPGDVQLPRELYPIFFGSFDWHSCVHGWWTLLTLRRLFPDMTESQAIAELADDGFTPGNVASEQSYFERPSSRTFERPYGWAWLLSLHLEAVRHHDRKWGANLEPLAMTIAGRFRDYLPVLTYPIRSGAHFNTAFALALAVPWADQFDPALADIARDRARDWFEDDRDCPAWEPSGDDFVSPALTEALCMSRVLEPTDFERWIAGFLPRLADRDPGSLFAPAIVSDRSDGKIAHLDGLNLSRAWCWRSLAHQLGPDQAQVALGAANLHLGAAMPHVSGDYMGEHWLASFALLALLA